MEEYDDELPDRKFDNFQFVCYNKIRRDARANASRVGATGEAAEAFVSAQFALHALMEIPDQYTYIRQAGLLEDPVPQIVHTMIQNRFEDLAPCPDVLGVVGQQEQRAGGGSQAPSLRGSGGIRASGEVAGDGVARISPLSHSMSEEYDGVAAEAPPSYDESFAKG